jgi:hypothetical protein
MKKIKEAKSERLQGLTDKTVKQAFLKFVVDEERSESVCLEMLVKDGLKDLGYLK